MDTLGNDLKTWLSSDTTTDQNAGLFIVDNDATSVPLASRSISAAVDCDLQVATVVEKHVYSPTTDCIVNFRFPIPPKAAVYRFQATIGDCIVRTEVKEKQAALNEYTTAVNQGQTAVLLKQDGSDIFTTQLGNLEANVPCIVEISYIKLLDKIAGTIEFNHSSTWVPPYISSENPPLTPSQNAAIPVYANMVSYTLAYDIRVSSGVPIKSISAPSYPKDLSVFEETPNEGSQGGSHGGPAAGEIMVVSLSEEVSDPSKDFQMLVELQGNDGAGELSDRLEVQKCIRADGPKTYVKATFIPRLPSDHPPAAPTPKELWFVVDCSGSMYGSACEQARDAASFFIQDLPPDSSVFFNLVVFGSNHLFWSRGCKEYNAESSAGALAWARKHVNDEMGGTEFYRCLSAIYDVDVRKGYTREIVFVTDGGVDGGQEERVLKLVNNQGGKKVSKTAAATRLFCLGVGHGVHKGFIDGVAERSGGLSQYVTPEEDIAVKAGFLKKCALTNSFARQPRILGKSCVLRLAPASLPGMLFPGEPITVLAEVLKSDGKGKISLEMTTGAGGKFSQDLALESEGKSLPDGDTLAVLHSMCSISALLAGKSPLHLSPDGTEVSPGPSEESVRAEVLRIALQEGLVTPFTAAVGVALRENPTEPGKTKTYGVPIQFPSRGPLQKLSGADDSEMLCASGGGFQSFGMPLCSCAKRSAPMSIFAQASPAPAMLCSAPGGSRGMFGGIMGRLKGFGGSANPTRSSSRREACSFGAPATAPEGNISKSKISIASDEESCSVQIQDQFKPSAAVLSPSSSPLPAPAALVGSLASPQESISEKSERLEALSVGPQPNSALDSRTTVLRLNELRTVEGFWPSSPEVVYLVLSKAPAAGNSDHLKEFLASKKPHEDLGEAEWTTVLVLAFLSKRLAGEKALWGGMEAKAQTWLAAHWPASCPPLGATIFKARTFV